MANTDIGHNSEVDSGHLRAFVERVERLETEIRDLNEGKAEIFKEARGTGFNVKVLKKVIARRRMDRQKRIEEDEIMSLYLESLGEE